MDSTEQLLKIDAIRISLCLSIEILCQLTEGKKTGARPEVFRRIDRLFKYLYPFITHKDEKSLEYVRLGVKIIRNCADNKDLLKNLPEQQDCVLQLIKVAETALVNENFDASSLEARREIILQILDTFDRMHAEDVPALEQHPYKLNAQDLIEKLRDNDDGGI